MVFGLIKVNQEITQRNKMNKLIFLLGILSINSILFANQFECKDIYTTITSKKGDKPYIVDGSKGNGNTKITLEFAKDSAYIIVGSDRTKLTYVSEGSGSMYFTEKTSSGNINLYSFFKDLTLTISKSYDLMGIANMNVLTIYECK